MELSTWAFQEQRTRQDGKWAIAYALTIVATLAGTAYSLRNASSAFFNIGDSAFMGDPQNCPVDAHGRSLREAHIDEYSAAKEFWGLATGWLIASAVVSLALGALFVLLFQKAARIMVYLACVLQVLILLALGLLVPDLPTTIVCIAFAAILGFWYFNFHLHGKLDLVARLLAVAGKGLGANAGLMPTSLIITVASAAALVPLIISFTVSACNGSLVRNPEGFYNHSTGLCHDSHGLATPCCSWQRASWVMPYWVLVGLSMLWTVMVASQIRTYTIAGSITQWYFTTQTKGTTLKSLSHALTTSFGSVCASSLILTFCTTLRTMLHIARSRRNIVALLIACLVSPCLTIIEFISQFATVQMAATGEPFFEATNGVTQLLARNAMSSLGVWWVPTMVLRFSAFALSVLWGVAVGFVSLAMWSSEQKYHYSGMNAAILGYYAGLLCFIVLSFTSAVLRDIVNTVYICYARDRDNNAVSNAEVHAVYAELPPAKGAVVVQPDQQMVYGAMEEGNASPRGSYQALVDTTTRAPAGAPLQAMMTREIATGARKAAEDDAQQPLLDVQGEMGSKKGDLE